MIGEVLTATVLVYDEMENISMDETSILLIWSNKFQMVMINYSKLCARL